MNGSPDEEAPRPHRQPERPPDPDTLQDMIRHAVRLKDPVALRAIAKIYRFHGDAPKARTIQRLARLMRQVQETETLDKLAAQVEERIIRDREKGIFP